MANNPFSYYEVLTAAVKDLSEHGYDLADRVIYWSERLKEAAQRLLGNERQAEQLLKDGLAQIYQRLVEQGKIVTMHPGVARYTIEKIKPALRAELDRRIFASANLIKLNRAQAIDKTIQRFQGWATSIPAGGSDNVDKVEQKATLQKALKQLPFEERRVLIDQGAKLTASINNIVAVDGGAIALRWHSHWREQGYDYRPSHKVRDEKIYLIRGSWAKEKGLIKPGPAGYYEDITAVAEEPFCRCYATYIYNLRDLPSDMLTAAGQKELDEARAKVRAMLGR